MKAEGFLVDLYASMLPPVRERPLETMPKSLYAYVFATTGGQQLRLCLLTSLVFPLTLLPLELQRRIVDDAVSTADFHLMALLGGMYFGVTVLHGGLKYVRNVYLSRIAEGIARVLRKRIAHGQTLADAADEGTAQSIMSSEAEKIGGFVAESLAFPLLQAGIVVSVAIYMLIVEPLIALVALGFLVPAAAIIAVAQPILDRLSEQKINASRDLGEAVLRDGRSDADGIGDPDPFIDRIFDLRLRFAIIKHLTKALNNLSNHMGPLSVLMVGGWLVIEGRTEIGTIVAFMSGYERMAGPARDLLNFYRRLSVMRVQYGLIYDAAAKT